MLKRLHSRLLFSYGVVIITALLIVALALLGFAALSGIRFSQPLQRLASISAGTRNGLIRVMQSGGNLADLEQVLAQTAVDQNVRILVTSTTTRRVIFDSDPGQAWLDVLITEVNNPTRLFAGSQGNIIAGQFRHPDNNSRWLVYGEPLTGNNRIIIFYVQPAPTALRFFREFFLRPLCGAGLIAFMLSILLAFGIARSVARPLQRLAEAATAVSAGDYAQQVEPAGPEEVRRVGTSFNNMAARVQATQQAQRDFVANVSHDLKTPITAITGWSQALLDGTADSPAAQQQAAGVIYNEAERMARMVSQLLDLARIESGQIKLNREIVDLRQLLTDLHRSLMLQAREREIHFTADLQMVPPLTGDPDRLMQIFTNLLDNALTHTPRQGRVHLSLKRHGDNGVEVRVQDSGKGIAPDELSRIFERFYQVDKSRARRSRAGSGLGLAIVNELVSAHHGRIQAYSEVGKGTVFVVRLPIRDEPAAKTVASRR